MEKLRIEIGRYGPLVFGKVLEMPERLRGKDKLWEGDGFMVCSVSHPALEKDRLYVRGTHLESDMRLFLYLYPAEVSVEEAVQTIKRAVAEINAGLPCDARGATVPLEVLE